MAEFFRITRVRANGREDVLRDIPIESLTYDQLERAQAYADAEERKATGIRVRVYSSSDGVVRPGDTDLIWDSAVNV